MGRSQGARAGNEKNPDQAVAGSKKSRLIRMPGEDYVRLAIGRDYADAAPMRGVIHGAASHTLRVEVTVMPLATQSARTQGTAPAND